MKCPFKDHCALSSKYPKCSCTLKDVLNKDSAPHIEDWKLRRAIQTNGETTK